MKYMYKFTEIAKQYFLYMQQLYTIYYAEYIYLSKVTGH